MFAINHILVSNAESAQDDLDGELWHRRSALLGGLDDDDAWRRRSFPVLSVLAPAVSTSTNKVEFPGDPMCLYHALTKAIADVVAIRERGLSETGTYNDFCPFWDKYPSASYRRRVSVGGIRSISELNECKTDGSVFDPRVWNREVEAYFRKLLGHLTPRVVLVSTVSPAYRYAARILEIVRAELPDAITILGGRHIDATVDAGALETRVTESNPLSDMKRGKLSPCIDLMLSGQCYYSLSAILQAVALCIPIGAELGFPDRRLLHERILHRLIRAERGGTSTAILCRDTTATAFHVSGPPVVMRDLPSPYAAFSIRAQFPVFCHTKAERKRTAHINIGLACPFSCDFCSESRLLQAGAAGDAADVNYAIEELERLIGFGATSAFFDDSIFFSGAGVKIIQFCDLMTERVLPRAGNFEWGAQFTVSVVEAFISRGVHRKVLQGMSTAGCTYLYFGIESLSGKIMRRISKTSRSSTHEWQERVENVLQVVKSEGISVGASVLFGLEGETIGTIEETIAGVEEFLEKGLLSIVSPNLMTYHPGTEITSRHGRENRLGLEHAKLGDFVREPYSFFEEAFPGMVSRELSEEMIWHIHCETLRRWGKGRNKGVMPEVRIPKWSFG